MLLVIILTPPYFTLESSQEIYQIATLSSAQFMQFDDFNFGLQYVTAESRITRINLQCDESGDEPVFTFLAERPPLTYNFILLSSAACYQPPAPSGGGSGGWSLGDVLLLIFFLLLILYVIVGVLFNFFYKKQSGVALVPNNGFWFAVPGLVRDGGLFIVGIVLRRKAGYSEV
jgi:hypothetical protein